MKTIIIMLFTGSIAMAASPSPTSSPYAHPSPEVLKTSCTAEVTCGDGSKISCKASGPGASCTNGKDPNTKLRYVECKSNNDPPARSNCAN